MIVRFARLFASKTIIEFSRPACGAKCTKCRISNFTVASTVNQKQCTECLPGFFLNKGTCIETCPSGTTVSAQDGRTCICKTLASVIKAFNNTPHFQRVTLLAAPALEHRHFALPAITTKLRRTANAFLLVLSGHSPPPVFVPPVTPIVPLVQAVVLSTNARLVLQVDQSCPLDDVCQLALRTSSSIRLAVHVKNATIPAQAVRVQVPQIV